MHDQHRWFVLPPAGRRGRRAHRRRRVHERGARRRSASASGPRTSRRPPRRAVRRASSASTPDAISTSSSATGHRARRVSTQFLMMLNSAGVRAARPLVAAGACSPAARRSLRAGRRVRGAHRRPRPPVLRIERDRRAQPHDARDDREHRLRTAGRVIAVDGRAPVRRRRPDVTRRGPGQPACRGPPLPRLPDDDGGQRRAVHRRRLDAAPATSCRSTPTATSPSSGRASDFIIRGGKNISAAAVEDEVGSHPAVALAARSRRPTRCSASGSACTSCCGRARRSTSTTRRAPERPRGVTR